MTAKQLQERIERTSISLNNQVKCLDNLKEKLTDASLCADTLKGVLASIEFGETMIFKCKSWIEEDEEALRKLQS